MTFPHFTKKVLYIPKNGLFEKKIYYAEKYCPTVLIRFLLLKGRFCGIKKHRHFQRCSFNYLSSV